MHQGFQVLAITDSIIAVAQLAPPVNGLMRKSVAVQAAASVQERSEHTQQQPTGSRPRLNVDVKKPPRLMFNQRPSIQVNRQSM